MTESDTNRGEGTTQNIVVVILELTGIMPYNFWLTGSFTFICPSPLLTFIAPRVMDSEVDLACECLLTVQQLSLDKDVLTYCVNVC